MSEPRIQKLQEIPLLLDVYGCLLTDRQKEALSLFYEEDLSLSEIAQLHSSSRQAVHNLIERGESLLREYERQLHVVADEQHRNTVRSKLELLIAACPLPETSKREIEELLCQL